MYPPSFLVTPDFLLTPEFLVILAFYTSSHLIFPSSLFIFSNILLELLSDLLLLRHFLTQQDGINGDFGSDYSTM